MKILIITDIFEVGGSTTFLIGLANFLKSRGHDLTLVTFGDRPYFQDTFKQSASFHFVNTPHYYSVRSLPFRLRKLFSLLATIKSANFDLILLDLILPSISLLLLQSFFGFFSEAKIVYQFHGSDTLERISAVGKEKLLKRVKIMVRMAFERYVYAKVNLILTFSQYSKKLVTKVAPGMKVLVTRPGISYLLAQYSKKTKKEARLALGLHLAKKIILIVSRIEPRKGVSQFIAQVPKYAHLLQGSQIIVISDFERAYYNMFNLEGFGSTIPILCVNKPHPQLLAHYYTAADLCVVPSLDLETFGFVTYESYFFGTPVVGFDVGANRELIPSEYLVKKSGDWKGLFEKVNEKLNDTTETPQLDFSWKKYESDICR